MINDDHSARVVELIPELVNLTNGWPQEPHTIWRSGPAIPLAKPLRTGGGMYNRRVRCDLDLLLTCETVQEIEAEMGKRRD